MVHGLKKLITKHGYQNFIFLVWYLAKRKRKTANSKKSFLLFRCFHLLYPCIFQRSQHWKCLTVRCINECSGLIAGIHRLIACLAGVWKEGKGEGGSKHARSAKGTWARAEGNSFHPPPLLADSHPNSLPHPFWMPAVQANWLKVILIGGRLFCVINMPLNFLFQDRCSQFWNMFNSSVWKS